MNTFKYKSTYLIFFVVILTFHHSLLANDDFNAFATKIYENDIEGIEELLNKGVDVNIREETMGSTPLIVACSMEGKEEIIKLLISKGADVNIQGSYDGRTALIWAAGNSKGAVEMLLAEGADVKLKGVDGMTAFIQSIFGILSESVTTEVCDLLLEKGAEINAQLTDENAPGWTALMFAVTNGSTDLVKYLVSKSADVNIKTVDGTTAMSLAEKENNTEIISVLKSDGAIN